MKLKQAFLFMVMILGLTAVSACSGSDSPSDVVSKAYDAIIDGNYREAAKYICYDDGTLPTAEEQKELAQELNNYESERFVSYKITSVDFNNDAKTVAEVWMECTYPDGRTEINFEDMMKVDGKWYISISGEGSHEDYEDVFNALFED